MIDQKHDRVLSQYKAIIIRPYLMFFIMVLSFVALIWSISIFIRSSHIIPTQMYIPTTASDTAVHVVPTNLPVLPHPNQEEHPGERLNEQESIQSIKSYLKQSLKECFTMNYINMPHVLSKCKSYHLDSESNAQDVFVNLLNTNNFTSLLHRYKTSSSLSFLTDTPIKLIRSGTVSMPHFGGLRTRYVWIFSVKMKYAMQSINITSPETWEVEIIRESALNKELPISIFKIRSVD